MVVAIDGPAGSGKSTIARLVAKGLNFTFVNSGALYRAYTLACLRAGVDPGDAAAVIACAASAQVEFRNGRVHLDGEDVGELLHTDRIDALVAGLSALVPLRHQVNDLVRSIAGRLDVVVEGRDITTVVFPDARYRFYLDASVESRAKRRYDQGTSLLAQEEIADSIRRRDHIDRNKAEGSLKLAPGVVYLDTSDLTIRQVYDKLLAEIQI